MSVSKVIKKYRELAKECTKFGFKNYTLLVSDSKGACIRRVAPSLARFDIISKAGAGAADNKLADTVIRRIQNKKNPVVITWFGTCEITKKRGKYISIRTPPYQNAEICIKEALNFRDKITKANKGARVIFLDCPYYSPKKYNLLNKKRTNKEETNNKKSVKSVNPNQTVSQDINNNLQVTINRNSNTGKRRV